MAIQLMEPSAPSAEDYGAIGPAGWVPIHGRCMPRAQLLMFPLETVPATRFAVDRETFRATPAVTLDRRKRLSRCQRTSAGVKSLFRIPPFGR